MARFRKIEEVFLYTLQESSPKEEISKRMKCFGDDQWQALYKLAIDTYLYPVFYNRLLILKLKNIPFDFLCKLKNLYLLNLKRNIRLEREISGIINYFRKLSIPIIPLKGPILARYLYNDVGLRQASCDLDIMVKHETVSQVKEKLGELGYDFCLLEQKRDFLRPVGSLRPLEQIVFVKDIDSTFCISLDLHWCIRGFFSDQSIQRLWQEAGYFALDDQKILMPTHQDCLIYLSLISISSLEFVKLKYLYDIHRLVTVFGKELDWERLLGRVRQLNLENCLYFPLNLSKIMFLTDIPNAFLEQLRPNWFTRRLISSWINENSVLGFRKKSVCSYPLRYLLGRYLYSRNSADFLEKSFRRIMN